MKPIIFCFRRPRLSLPERMVRRYSTASENDEEEPRSRSNSQIFNIFGRRRSSSGNNKPNRFKQLARHLSVEEAETYKEKLAAVGDLMSVFYDDEDEVSSDQDDLIEELHDIGYFITPKDMDSKTDLDSGFDESEELQDISHCNTPQDKNLEMMTDNSFDEGALWPKCTPTCERYANKKYENMKHSNSTTDFECSRTQSILKRKFTF